MPSSKRPYTSPLRAAQVQQTRERILDAAIELLGEGAAALTVPAVAKTAGVAVPTVYRHFGTKEALEDAVAERARALVGVGPRKFSNLAGLIEASARNWMAAESLPPGTLTVMMASVARNLDDPDSLRSQEVRREWIREGLSEELAELAPEDQEHFVRLCQALCSSIGAVAYRRTGCGQEEASVELGWLLRSLLAGLRRREG